MVLGKLRPFAFQAAEPPDLSPIVLLFVCMEHLLVGSGLTLVYSLGLPVE